MCCLTGLNQLLQVSVVTFVVEVSRDDVVEVFGCVQLRIEGGVTLTLNFADYLCNEG